METRKAARRTGTAVATALVLALATQPAAATRFAMAI